MAKIYGDTLEAFYAFMQQNILLAMDRLRFVGRMVKKFNTIRHRPSI